MQILRVRRLRILPTEKQINIIKQYFTAAWIVDRWLLKQLQEHYDKYKKILTFEEKLAKFEEFKKTPDGALLEKFPAELFLNVLKNRKELAVNARARYGRITLSLGVSIKDSTVYIPDIGQLVVTEEDYLPKNEDSLNITLYLSAGRWFIDILCSEEHDVPVPKGQPIVVKILPEEWKICTDNNLKFDNLDVIYKELVKINRRIVNLNKKLMGQTTGSGNWYKTIFRINKYKSRIKYVKKNLIHQITAALIGRKKDPDSRPRSITVMVPNTETHEEFFSVFDFKKFCDVLEYKAQWFNCRLKYVPSDET